MRLTSHRHTLKVCYLAYITQAIVNNLCPLLFLTFRREFGLSIPEITMITTVNFAVQLLTDFLSSFLVDRIGYRPCVVTAHALAFLGLTGLAWMPSVLPPFAGIMTAVVLYAVGGGLIEVLVSPIVESCPTEGKERAMSLLHSFYCWGQAGTVLAATLFFVLFGTAHWRILACVFALLPLGTGLLFTAVPLYPVTPDGASMRYGEVLRSRVFWVLMLLMVCAGASELAMSQWSSAFAEAALGVSKTVGDLAGPCAFALLMGTSRALYAKLADRLSIRTAMIACAVLCAGCYLLASLAGSPAAALAGCAVCGFSVGVFWPGTFSMAASSLPRGGTAMFALMALAGDVGCSGGPTLVGLLTSGNGGDLRGGLLIGIVFPLVIIAAVPILGKLTRRAE